TASGVQIGPVTIGRIFNQAVTKAHGRHGTTHTDWTRTISDVHGPGIDCATTCDPRAVIDGINQALAGHARVSLPEPTRVASPHGYTGTVSKPASRRNTDRLVNDDDTVTADALDVLLIN